MSNARIVFPNAAAEIEKAESLVAKDFAATGYDYAGFGLSRPCLRPAIPEIEIAANQLEEAVAAHLAGDSARADLLIRASNTPVIRDWVESIWGRYSPYNRLHLVDDTPILPKDARVKQRMPSSSQKLELLARDGFRCRFCGIPVVRGEVRKKLHSLYPDALPWGTTNASQHAGFQAMWAQFDHVVPHSRGGDNELLNIVVTCGPCNFGRMQHTLKEVGLSDPRLRSPIRGHWAGLESLMA
jgi:5-methylcytosine-specific restriction endonuclease McrA